MDPGSSPTTTTETAMNLDIKPQLELMQQQQHHHQQQQQQQTQKMRKLVRRNASDKLKLIQMVHDNPILWDSRLPNFKGAEEEKTRAWEHIGKEFSAPGRRVARAFKSLRESYRRELAHVKVMGTGFKPKWSLYDAMDFLRDVIRERKGGSHMTDHSAGATGLNLSALAHHNIGLTHNNNNNNNNHKSALKHNSLHSSFNDSALNLSSRSSLNLSQDDYYYFVKPDMNLSAGSNAQHQQQPPVAAHNADGSAAAQLQQQHHHDTRVSSTRNDSNAQHNHNNSSNHHNNSNNYDEDIDASSLRSGDENSVRNAALSQHGSDEVEELDAIDADFPYPLILDNSNSPTAAGAAKRRRKELKDSAGGAGDDDEDEDEDMHEEDSYGGQMLQQHRHLRQQNGLDMPPPQTVREVLNSKFCGFISAKLNSMEDTEADNLMNKILMLLVQTQGNSMPQEAK